MKLIAFESLLIAALLAGQLSFAQVEDMSGSGEGSGDSDESCRRPASPTMPTNRETDARNEIRCHLACIDKVSAKVFILW